MPERRAVSIDQIHEVKDHLEILTNQVHEIDEKLSSHIELNKSDVLRAESSFLEVKQQLIEVKSKVDEIETSLPARILIVEDNLATIREHQTSMTPKVNDIYEIISVWRGFSKAISWISDNVSKIIWIFTTIAAIGTGGYYIVEYVRGNFKVVPVQISYKFPISSPKVILEEFLG